MSEAKLLKSKPTTIVSWALLIAQVLDRAAVDGKQLFLDAGIDLDSVSSPQERLLVADMAKVWALAVERTGDPYFALRLAPVFQPSMYSAMGVAMASSRSVKDALQRCVKYYQLTSDAAILSLELQPQSVDLVYVIPEGNRPVADEAMEAFCITLVALFRNAIDSLAPLAVEFEHEKSLDSAPFEAYFRCPVTFGQPVTRLRFSADVLDQPLLFANPELARVIDEWGEQYLSSFRADQLSTKVKAYILQHLALGETDQAHAAKELGVSVRSMQRKLGQEGTTYSELLDECRHKMALKYIAQKKIPIIEIAYLLGFSDQSNFSRSFRRWTNTTPQKYREQSLAG
ncbi:MAG: AraC family transcriptional regulator [Gammaproteobacteria bacterium]|uniref:AraC family transcriptional regulator n=1 Tax=Pseudomaricurvus alcaniphilus TaxID=1166482 RepID=UPI00140A2055|nr:AraC family transcriptional regulator [Pseudomaricurvus alcaniphilus]MBR9909462.1 AraC family transcriptional regulator [Gammaproteobacteria bacterium]NHN37133.1 AraC family transcriptional regulator [Pseudomaricurvus alcaniphilus]